MMFVRHRQGDLVDLRAGLDYRLSHGMESLLDRQAPMVGEGLDQGLSGRAMDHPNRPTARHRPSTVSSVAKMRSRRLPQGSKFITNEAGKSGIGSLEE